MKKQKLNVRMPPHIHLELAEIAYENGLSMNSVAVMALQNYIGYVTSNGRLPGTHAKPQRARQRAESVERPARNAPCHCGSGKKYKRCCYPV